MLAADVASRAPLRRAVLERDAGCPGEAPSHHGDGFGVFVHPQEAPAEVMGLIGNAVGAMAVGMIGNRTAIERTPLVRFLISLFK